MLCDNSENQKFCAQNCNYTPVCPEVNKDDNYTKLFYWTGTEESGILLKLFELKDVLLSNHKIKFSAKGFCMYPVIQATDKLQIELKKAKEIKVGEVAVYRRNNRLFAHRTIAKGSADGRDYIITCPDNAKIGNDGPSFDENIAGVVTAIERKGRILSVEKKPCSVLKNFYLELYFALLKLRWMAITVALYGLAFLQQSYIFRKIFQLFFRASGDLKFSIQLSLNNNLNSLFSRSVSVEELISFMQEEPEGKIRKWMLAENIKNKIVASCHLFAIVMFRKFQYIK